MKICVVTCVFYPEPIASASTSRDLAQELANQGHIVKVITAFPNRPAGRLFEGYQRRLWLHERTVDSYDILRVFSFFSPRSSLVSRFMENISFGIASSLAVLLAEEPDVIYANTWPIFAQGFLMLTCWLRRIPLILSIQDLYPESLFVQKRGINKSSTLFRSLHWLEKQIARHCAGLIVISERFRQTYIHDRGVPKDRIVVIPNWIDDAQTIDVSATENIRKTHGIPKDAFVAVYGGNIGVAAGVEFLIDAFRHLISHENIYLLIAGSGSDLSNCRELIQTHALTHVKIHSPWQTLETFPVLLAADLCILPTQGEQSLVSVPSKLLTYMLAGRPVLALASPESDTAKVMNESRAGWVVSDITPLSLANTIIKVSKLSREECERYGQLGRSHALNQFTKKVNLSKVINFLFHHNEMSSSIYLET